MNWFDELGADEPHAIALVCHPTEATQKRLDEIAGFDKYLGALGLLPPALTGLIGGQETARQRTAREVATEAGRDQSGRFPRHLSPLDGAEAASYCLEVQGEARLGNQASETRGEEEGEEEAELASLSGWCSS